MRYAELLMELPAWVLDNLPQGWDAPEPVIPQDLPEISLIALFKATRLKPDSPAGKLAATLLVERYSAWVDRIIRQYSPEGQRAGPQRVEGAVHGVVDKLDNRYLDVKAQEVFQEGWRGFIEAVHAYKAGEGAGQGRRTAGLTAFAEAHIKRRIIEQIFRNLPRRAYSDDTRKAYKQTLKAWATLAQEKGHEPTPEEVADYLAPQLTRLFHNEARARRAILDVFQTLRTDDPTLVEEPDEEEESNGGGWVQVSSDFMQPEEVALSEEARATSIDALTSVFRRCCRRLNSINAARKLLILQVLLNANTVGLDSGAGYDLDRIAHHINRLGKEITALWSFLWVDLALDRFGIPPEWSSVRLLFNPPVSQEDLRKWYEFHMDVVGWF